jgi:hypothetical protein
MIYKVILSDRSEQCPQSDTCPVNGVFLQTLENEMFIQEHIALSYRLGIYTHFFYASLLNERTDQARGNALTLFTQQHSDIVPVLLRLLGILFKHQISLLDDGLRPEISDWVKSE